MVLFRGPRSHLTCCILLHGSQYGARKSTQRYSVHSNLIEVADHDDRPGIHSVSRLLNNPGLKLRAVQCRLRQHCSLLRNDVFVFEAQASLRDVVA
jgi:hypothetical protein